MRKSKMGGGGGRCVRNRKRSSTIFYSLISVAILYWGFSFILVIYDLVAIEFGLKHHLYSTAEGSGGVEICIEVLQGNVTQRTLIGMENGIGSVQGKYHCQIE